MPMFPCICPAASASGLIPPRPSWIPNLGRTCPPRTAFFVSTSSAQQIEPHRQPRIDSSGHASSRPRITRIPRQKPRQQLWTSRA
eukprot:732640-Rhodomonas_salina.1